MMDIDTKATSLRLEEFIRTRVTSAGFQGVVVAVSGGVDSATTLTLTARALGSEHVTALLMPYGSGGEGVRHAKFTAAACEIPKKNIITTNIKPLLTQLFTHIPQKEKLRRGNAMARMRMIVLYDVAKTRRLLVVGTENKSEHLLGYYTRFGDEASDIEPLKHLYKTQVYQLASYLKVPQPIITKPPTAGLWKGQTDEDELGFSYDVADQIFYLTADKQLSIEEVVARGYPKDIVEKVITRAAANDFKHHLPLVPPEL